MAIDCGSLSVGNQYDRPYLAELWGYADWHAIGRGAVTPRGQNIIILFITKEKQQALQQYKDDFDGESLWMEGEDKHASDERLRNSPGRDQVYLFYRERHHLSFTYYGEIFLANFNRGINSPSNFIFAVSTVDAKAVSAIVTDEAASGDLEEQFVPDAEGRRRYREHVIYERSRRNRAKAIEIHGTQCKACGFDFNSFYGEDLAKDFIQVHHIRSITKSLGPVDPATDLIPLCSNCHSMVHRNMNDILTIEELNNRVAAQRILMRRKDGRQDAEFETNAKPINVAG